MKRQSAFLGISVLSLSLSHTPLTYTGDGRKKGNERETREEKKGQGREREKEREENKTLSFKPITPIMMHTYFKGDFDCIIFNNQNVAESSIIQKLIMKDAS